MSNLWVKLDADIGGEPFRTYKFEAEVDLSVDGDNPADVVDKIQRLICGLACDEYEMTQITVEEATA